MMGLLMEILSWFEDPAFVVYEKQAAGTAHPVLVLDVDSKMPFFEDEELFEQFMDILDEMGEPEFHDEFTLYELPLFDVIVVGDCVH